MTIFGVLFKFWPQFCEFRKNLTDEKIMSVLERRQEYNKQKKKLAVIEDEKFAKVREDSFLVDSYFYFLFIYFFSYGLNHTFKRYVMCVNL